MAKVAKFRLTLEGRTKLTKVLQRARIHAITALSQGCENVVKPIVASRAPTSDEERLHISKGLVTEVGSTGRGGYLGQADERRFNKAAGQHWLREAILAEPVVSQWRLGNLIVELGKLSLYNPGPAAQLSIGFSWKTHQGVRSTDDAEAGLGWKTLLQAWEYGGTIPVGPRGPNIYLEPERGIFVKGMLKTIPPHGMFTIAAPFIEDKLFNFMNSTLKKLIRTEFGLV